MALLQPIPALSELFRTTEQEDFSERGQIALGRNERLSPFPGWFMEILAGELKSELLNKYPVQQEWVTFYSANRNWPEDLKKDVRVPSLAKLEQVVFRYYN